jgi:hypothetical protein
MDRLVLNYPLPVTAYYTSFRPTSPQNRSLISDGKSTLQPRTTSQCPSYDASKGSTSGPHDRRAQPSPNGDRDKKEPLYCLHPDCLDSNGKPTRRFTRKAAVVRYHRSTHERLYIDCPKRNCSRKGPKGFTRIDHQIEHLRGYHGENIPKRLWIGRVAIETRRLAAGSAIQR